MADLSVLYSKTETALTTTATATWSDAAKIPAASFTAGKRYIILAGIIARFSTSSGLWDTQLVKGTTPFDDALFTHANPGASSSSTAWFGFVRDYTAPGTTEDVALQFKCNSAGTTTVFNSWLLAIEVSSLVEGTDFLVNEVLADLTTTASYQDGASVTIPANGTDRWLILAEGARDTDTTGSNVFQSIYDGSTDFETSMEGDAAATSACYSMARVVTPPAGSQTYKLRFKHELTAETIRSSRIVALNLERFAQVVSTYVAGPISPAVRPSFGNVATIAPTPATTGKWVVLGWMHRNLNGSSTGEDFGLRMQIDPSGGGLVSNPAIASSVGLENAKDATDIIPIGLVAFLDLSSGAARTINLDANVNVAGAQVAQQATLLAFSVVLAPVTDDETVTPPSAGLALGVTSPGLVIEPGPIIPPGAGIALGATAPLLDIVNPCTPDSICGEIVCGETVAGAWWACPPTGGLALGATAPVLDIVNGQVSSAGLALGATAPGIISTGGILAPASAGLRLGATAPTVAIDQRIAVPSAELRLGAQAPTSFQSSVIVTPSAGLALGGAAPAFQSESTVGVATAGLALGATTPDYVGSVLMLPVVCTDLELDPDTESDLVLVGAVAIDLDLDPQECR